MNNSMVISKTCDKERGVLYGIFSIANREEIRDTIRQQSQCDLNNDFHRTIFVMGKPRNQRDYEIVARESKSRGDIFMLTCDENMNQGKTYTYFKEVLEQFPCFKFYAKVDDDTAFVPNKLSAKILSLPNDGPLYIGRNSKTHDSTLNWVGKMITGTSFSSVLRLSRLQRYTAGLLYVLNVQAVKKWIALNPDHAHLCGDEDYVTTHFMEMIEAKVINLNTAFHDYNKYETNFLQDHWRLDITQSSLAVHQCKKASDLSDAFALLCA
jgi:hypothetical protein